MLGRFLQRPALKRDDPQHVPSIGIIGRIDGQPPKRAVGCDEFAPLKGLDCARKSCRRGFHDVCGGVASDFKDQFLSAI